MATSLSFSSTPIGLVRWTRTRKLWEAKLERYYDQLESMDPDRHPISYAIKVRQIENLELQLDELHITEPLN